MLYMSTSNLLYLVLYCCVESAGEWSGSAILAHGIFLLHLASPDRDEWRWMRSVVTTAVHYPGGGWFGAAGSGGGGGGGLCDVGDVVLIVLVFIASC